MQSPAAELAFLAVVAFVERFGARGLTVALTRDELARALAARAEATLAALISDLACFGRYCATHGLVGLPAAHESVARYVEQLWRSGPSFGPVHPNPKRRGKPATKPLKPASIGRRLASLGMLHELLRLANPCRDANVRNAMTIARRSCGVKQRQAAGVRLAAFQGAAQGGQGANTPFTLDVLLAACDNSLGGLRDAALISTAYDGGFRVSELIAMQLGDFVGLDNGERGSVALGKTKTDQFARGRTVSLYGDTMRRLMAWIERAEIGEEPDKPIFRRIKAVVIKGNKGRAAIDLHEVKTNASWDMERFKAVPPRATQVWREVGEGGLTASGVLLIIRRMAQRAADMGLVDLSGEDLAAAVKAISTHSLRVGLAQDLRSAGIEDSDTMELVGWKDPKSLLRYVGGLPRHESLARRRLAEARR